MDFKTENKEGFTLIKMQKPRLDAAIAPVLKSELVLVSGKGEKNIIIDVSDTSYCDSSGLSAILVANRLCKNNGGLFVLTGLQENVERLISVSQLNTVLSIADNYNEAVQIILNHISNNS